MLRIVHSFLTLEQHLRSIVTTHQSYHPGRCPHCGRTCLWAHGFYERNAALILARWHARAKSAERIKRDTTPPSEADAEAAIALLGLTYRELRWTRW